MTKKLIAGLAAALLTGCVSAGGPSTGTGPNGAASYRHVPVAGPQATGEERAACAAVGGEIRPVGLLGWDNCIQRLPDAGTPCTDSDQCLGRCLVAGAGAESGQPATGRCEPTDSPFGCNQQVIGGIADAELCVD
ncbi:MAG: hypothetical protein R3F55_18195 [Alphaproteobacteria bacterium]